MTVIRTRYWCQRGRAHRAYLHPGWGAAIIWCPRHGVLCSMTHEFGQGRSRWKMTPEQYRRFVTDRRKRPKRGGRSP